MSSVANPAGDPTDQGLIGSLERLITGAIGMTARLLVEEGQDGDLTLAQWRCLLIAGEAETGKRVGDIAARIGVSLPSASRLCRRLEQRGLVAAERDERDRRATLVRLTPAGARVRDHLLTRRQETIAALLHERREPLPSDLRKGLEAIAQAFERYR